MNLPKNCLLDTNVPKTANLAHRPDTVPQEMVACVNACVDAIEHVIQKRCLILDDGDEIFDEYRQQLSMAGQPGMGDRFMKWVHDNRWTLPSSSRVTITKNGDTYDQFPNHAGLVNFDRSDRKFVATSNGHSNKRKPPILQAVDFKWWGWKNALDQVGIKVIFMDPAYAEARYQEKHGG